MSHGVLLRRNVFLLFVSITALLQGCQQSNVREGAATGERTGQMGTLQRKSPADVYVQLASVYRGQGNHAVALQNAKKAVIVDPAHSNAHNILALVYQDLGEDAYAEQHFEKAINADPQNSYALNAYGFYLCGKGQYPEADALFNRAITNPLYQTPWVALTNAGICARKNGQTEQAETYLRNALQLNKQFSPALINMANVSYDNGNYLSARAYIQRYSTFAAHTAESLWLGIRTETQLGDLDQIASYKLLLLRNFPDSQQAKLLRGAR